MLDLGEAVGGIRRRAAMGMVALVSDAMGDEEREMHVKYGIPASVDLSEANRARAMAERRAMADAEVAEITQRYNDWHMRVHGTAPYEVADEFKAPPAEVVDAARRVCDRLEQGAPGFYFHGRPGRGKSLVADWVLKDWTADGWTGEKVEEKRLADAVKVEMDGLSERGGTIARYSRCGLLVLDDVGVVKPGQWFMAELCDLLGRRESAGLRTVVTSNMSRPQLREYLAQADPYGADRVASRLSPFVDLPFTGPDHRPAVRVVPTRPGRRDGDDQGGVKDMGFDRTRGDARPAGARGEADGLWP